MLQEIVGLRYEFIHRRGHYMMLHREEGLYAEELSEHQLRMLEANQIPRLLPLEVQEIDFRVHLLYNLTSKRMLSHVLKSEGFTKAQFFRLLYTITCAIDESGNYMLDEQQYVLRENFIFIGMDLSDIYLTYVPLRQMTEVIPIYRQIGGLVEQLGGRLKEGDQPAMRGLHECCNENFSLNSFKDKLLSLIGEAGSAATVIPFPKLSTSAKTKAEATGPTATSIINNVPEQPDRHISTQAASLPWKKTDLSDLNENNTLLLPEHWKLITLIMVVISLALLWSIYVERPSEASLHIAAGLSIWILDIWFTACYIGLPRIRPIAKKVQKPAEKFGHDDQDLSVPPASESVSQVQPANMQQYYENLHRHTTLLSSTKPDATVFLGAAVMNLKPIVAPVPQLDIVHNGEKVTIFLKDESIMIGRAEGEADVVLNEAGVSRLHAEVFLTEEGYAIKDIGSKNGTFLNGEQLVPYQAYKLGDQDTIRIVRVELVYKNPNITQ